VSRPALFVTNYAPPARVGAFAALAERTDVEFALFGGRVHHGGVHGGVRPLGTRSPEGSDPQVHGRADPGRGDFPFRAREVAESEVHALAASGDYGAVVAGTVGRRALPAAYLGARRARVPFVLWATLWSQPKSLAGLLGYPVLQWMYARADAVATYGPHVSAYVEARGATDVHDAPQAVDAGFWSAPVDEETATGHRRAPFQVSFAARMQRAKGVRVLISAWRKTGLAASDAALILVGDGPQAPRTVPSGAHAVGRLGPSEVRNFYAGSDVVVIPSIRTLTFREPWGLVANEAMHRGLPVIATDEVGAAAGGLVRDGRNGLVVPAGDAGALARAIRRLHDDPKQRRRLGEAARADVTAYTHAAWAEAMCRALADAGGARTQ
jgi:glycosyltransferase involved in cell wall biosynthesis